MKLPINDNQAQLTNRLIELATQADELGEKDMSLSMLIMATAIMTGESRRFNEWCAIYADAALDRAMEGLAAAFIKATGDKK